MNLKIREIFYSIQGEGHRVGTPSIFIRLANCNLNCWFCDTDWSYGDMMSVSDIKQQISEFNCKEIVWTGGEPTFQLNDEILALFPEYYHCIESNGTNEIPKLMDYVVVSPKTNYNHPIHESIIKVNEIRIPLLAAEQSPDINDYPKADNYYVSPIFLGKPKERFQISLTNVQNCIDFVLKNPQWKLSLQLHKIINVR